MRVFVGIFILMIFISGCSAQNGPDDEVFIKNTPEIVPQADVKSASKEKTKDSASAEIRPEEGWSLVWNDEFENTEKLESLWMLQDWPSYKNNELQYYSPNNVEVRDGKMVITTKRERFKGRHYTSGAVTTENIFEFTYGKIDIRAKIPKGQGMFPAFWLVNSNGGTWLPEIDIMENIGQKPNELHYVVHWETEEGGKKRDFTTYVSDGIDFSADYHNYGLIWDEDRITWTLDGIKVFETERFSPDSPLYLYLNTAVGGNWPGYPDPDDSYPKETLIDYVRIYQQSNEE
ncbi:glycoside hydrolase family 16 protein [Bacillus salacetis]|uniref:Glycoside hydrolase family 16 protein n=1 Tax=Bacillus salacetis TaxID=2315464 RepID=A0A3A1QUL0_9BACI|nr:glycoside hydrolase family 16 protein [Bacillus salacetis]RIW31837.1 glycoside hydrolase family 16 protein [Bacillus salacetis]